MTDAKQKAPTDWERMFPRTEQGLEFAIVEMLRHPALLAEMGWPPIVRVRRQVRIGQQLTDIAIEHEDGSATIIEVKQGGLSLRDYCTGIGQLIYQSLMAMSFFQTAKVRRVLATPGPISIDLQMTCIAADIDILPTMTMDQWHESLPSERTH
jgi:hypothetical protein